MPVISLLTDFGEQDGFIGVMKGVIWNIHPSIQFADLSHTVEPQNILQGALILGQSWRFFPPGTIFISVIDPGVGTSRKGLAARIGDYFFVSPDNGLITLPLQTAMLEGLPVECFSLENQDYWLSTISNSFHGRDIFAPVAAHIARGVPLSLLGPQNPDPIILQIPEAQQTARGVSGQILMADRFGNLITNITAKSLIPVKIREIWVGGHIIPTIHRTFGDAVPGQLIAMIDSSDRLSICIVNGNAAQTLAVKSGDIVEVIGGETEKI